MVIRKFSIKTNIYINDYNDNVFLRNEEDKFCNNLINLTYLNELTVLNNILFRYSNDEIYTFNGDILIAVNPFKKIPIYTKKSLTNILKMILMF